MRVLTPEELESFGDRVPPQDLLHFPHPLVYTFEDVLGSTWLAVQAVVTDTSIDYLAAPLSTKDEARLAAGGFGIRAHLLAAADAFLFRTHDNGAEEGFEIGPGDRIPAAWLPADNVRLFARPASPVPF